MTLLELGQIVCKHIALTFDETKVAGSFPATFVLSQTPSVKEPVGRHIPACGCPLHKGPVRAGPYPLRKWLPPRRSLPERVGRQPPLWKERLKKGASPFYYGVLFWGERCYAHFQIVLIHMSPKKQYYSGRRLLCLKRK